MAYEITREYFEALLARRDTVGMHAIGRALLALHQFAGQPGVAGFAVSDYEDGYFLAMYYQTNTLLTRDQLLRWQGGRAPRIVRYIDQLLIIAAMKRDIIRDKGEPWTQLRNAVTEYYDVLDSDSAEFINPAEAEVVRLAAGFGMTFKQALDIHGFGEVSGVMKL